MMERSQHIIHIAALITAELTGKIRDEERKELEQWKNESPENLRLYEDYHAIGFVANKFKFLQVNDLHEAYEGFSRRVERVVRRRRRVMFYRYASVVVLCFIIGGVLIFSRENRDSTIFLVERIEPGSNKAELTQPDGQKIDLTDIPHLTYVRKGVSAEDVLPDKSFALDSLRYNTITVPRGGEYTLTLSDGTLLKMNSESEIRFPENFSGKQREVYMKGEIYFEVAHDTTFPFVVHTDRGNIRVLGTSFNVRDYQEEAFLETTLVSGKVAFNEGGKSVVLKPSEQLRLNRKDGKITVSVVDARLCSSWKDGRFIFEKQRLEDIMNAISRWYNVKVFYVDDKLKNVLFTGNIKRYDDLNQVVNMLQLVNKVNIRINSNNIYIKGSE